MSGRTYQMPPMSISETQEFLCRLRFNEGLVICRDEISSRNTSDREVWNFALKLQSEGRIRIFLKRINGKLYRVAVGLVHEDVKEKI